MLFVLTIALSTVSPMCISLDELILSSNFKKFAELVM